MAKVRTVRKDGSKGDRVLTDNDLKVLALGDFAAIYSVGLKGEVDFRKRFDKADTSDPYGNAIRRFYEAGKMILDGK